jgi:OmpA-OmpF porin, OOP family
MKNFKKHSFFALILLFAISNNTFGQEKKGKEYNQLSIDFNIGANKPFEPFTPGYRTPTFNFISTNTGLRYMFNNNFGMRADFGFDSFKNAPESKEFKSNLFRGSIQGVASLGNVLDFRDFSERFSLLFHGGLGLASLRNENSDGIFNWKNNGAHEMISFMFGFTPQYKISEKFSVNLDWTLYRHLYQNRTFDMNSKTNVRGFDATMAALTVGVSYYIGKKEKHADWVENTVPLSDDESTKEIEKRIVFLESQLAKYDSLVYQKIMDAKKEEDLAKEEEDRTGIREIEKEEDKLRKVEKPEDRKSTQTKDVLAGKYDFERQTVGNFPFASPSILSVNQELVKQILSFLKENNTNQIEVHGYSSSEGDLEYNKVLSQQRAESFKNYLIGKGADKNRVKAVGKGIENPIGDNSTLEGRKMNRRVEVIVVR